MSTKEKALDAIIEALCNDKEWSMDTVDEVRRLVDPWVESDKDGYLMRKHVTEKEFIRLQKIRKLAEEQYERVGDIEFDEGAEVENCAEDGAHVQAWVWVRFDGTKLDKEVGK